MINFYKLYKDTKDTLELIETTKLLPGSTYITSNGTRVKYVRENNGEVHFEIVNRSPLVEGVTLEDFEDPATALRMFWKLSTKEINRDEDTD